MGPRATPALSNLGWSVANYPKQALTQFRPEVRVSRWSVGRGPKTLFSLSLRWFGREKSYPSAPGERIANARQWQNVVSCRMPHADVVDLCGTTGRRCTILVWFLGQRRSPAASKRKTGSHACAWSVSGNVLSAFRYIMFSFDIPRRPVLSINFHLMKLLRRKQLMHRYRCW